MKKILILAAIVALVGSVYAGLDMYTGKNFTPLMNSTLVSDNSVAKTSTVALAQSNPIAGLIGQGAILSSYQCTAGGAGAILSFKFYQCVSSNSIDGEITSLSFAVTNAAGGKVQAYKPNTSTGSYVRVVVTPSGAVTNASVSSILITE